MGTSFLLLVATACVANISCHPFEAGLLPKGLTRSSFLLVSKSPLKNLDVGTSPKADQDQGSIVSFLTLLLLSSIPDSAEEKNHDKLLVTSLQDQKTSERTLEFENFGGDLATILNQSKNPKMENREDQKILLAMALQRLFGDSSESEELEENLLARLSDFKDNLMTNADAFEKSQETLAKLIRMKSTEMSSGEKETSVYHNESRFESSKLPREVNTSLDKFAYRDGHRTKKFDISSEEDEDLIKFTYRDEYGIRLPMICSEENDDLDTFAYRDEQGIKKFKCSSEESDDLDTFAYRDEQGIRIFKSSSEERYDSDTFAYRDEQGIRKFKSSSEEKDDLDTFAYRDEQGIRKFSSSSQENDDSDTFAYRDGFEVRRFKMSSEEDDDFNTIIDYHDEHGVKKYNEHSSKEVNYLNAFAFRDDHGRLIGWFPGF